jgi:hypothetical protein
MRYRIVLATGLLLCIGMAGCGSGGGRGRLVNVPSGSTQKAVADASLWQHRRGDGDDDDERGEDNPRSDDDYPLTTYGHEATGIARRKIVALTGRYYAASVAGNGRRACSMLVADLAKDPSITTTVPEDRFSRLVPVHVPAGRSCDQVTTLLFRRFRRKLREEAPTMEVTGVRVSGSHGVVLLRFRTRPEQWIPVAREGHVWKVQALFAAILP